ncbi:MAG: lipopolysaccharide heptosyltransferase II [Candidatus Cloacimonetes bacterium]|nr:lipopolysaccharide heptosyltransferase II [Candidatus Cloacimonadota bacterium]
MREIKRILIAQTAFIGDVILVTPLIRETKKQFPAAKLDVLVIPATKAILANNPHLSEVLVFDKKGSKIRSFFSVLRKIKERDYDLALIPHSSFTTALIAKLAGIKERIGFSKKLRSLLMTKTVTPETNIYRIDKNLSLLQPMGVLKGDRQTELFPSKEDKKIADDLIQSVYKPLVAVAPGSVWKTKCWPKEYYIELISLIKDRANFVFIGSQEENALCDTILKNSGCVGINIAGKTTILQSAAVIDKCKFILCNDSGALHVSNAVQTRVVGFFGPTVKKFGFFPFREGDLVFETNQDCRPCSHHGPIKCPLKHHNCMRLIKPQEVFEKINKFLS